MGPDTNTVKTPHPAHYLLVFCFFVVAPFACCCCYCCCIVLSLHSFSVSKGSHASPGKQVPVKPMIFVFIAAVAAAVAAVVVLCGGGPLNQ